MAEPSTHINYSFEDIQRYLQGKMSAAEMHDIEKAALQDPFLADAIEGYNEVDLAAAKQHLNEINAALFGENQRSKVVAFNTRTRWLNVAAIIIIVAGISIFSIYLLNSPGKQEQVAQVKKESANTQPLKDSATEEMTDLPAKPDTTLLVAKNKNVQEPSALKSLPSLKKENANGSTSSDKNLQADETTPTVMAVPSPGQQDEYASKAFNAAPSSNPKNDSLQGNLTGRVNGINLATNTFSGKVTDEKNQPVAGVVIESADKKTAVVTNISGDFFLQKNDSVINITASTIGYETKTANLKSGNNNIIRLRGTDTALNDVVVVGYGTAKKIKAADETAIPVGGWQNFNNYVLSQLNKDTTTAAITNANDLVEIEFLIDKAGNPYDIKITKPLDEHRNAKAIEILKSGPKWTNTSKKKKTRLTISF